MDEFYHASRHSYSTGQRVTASSRTVTRSLAATERVLKERKPPGALDRTEALYGFHSPALAACYGYLKYGNENFHVYRVSMNSPEQHPMALVNAIQQRGANPTNKSVTEIADEYWVPSGEWRVWECLARDMVVLEKTSPPSRMMAGVALKPLMEDQESIRDRWPQAVIGRPGAYPPDSNRRVRPH